MAYLSHFENPWRSFSLQSRSVEFGQPFLSGKSARNALRVKMYGIVFQERHYRIKSPNSRTDMSAHSFMTTRQYIPWRFWNITPSPFFVVCRSYITQMIHPQSFVRHALLAYFIRKSKGISPLSNRLWKRKECLFLQMCFRHLKGFYSPRFGLQFLPLYSEGRVLYSAFLTSPYLFISSDWTIFIRYSQCMRSHCLFFLMALLSLRKRRLANIYIRVKL